MKKPHISTFPTVDGVFSWEMTMQINKGYAIRSRLKQGKKRHHSPTITEAVHMAATQLKKNDQPTDAFLIYEVIGAVTLVKGEPMLIEATLAEEEN